MRVWRWMGMVSVVAATIGCAEESTNTNNATNGMTNGATNAATNGTNNAAAGACLPAVFAETLPFDANDALPFSFEIPAGYGNLDESTTSAIAGSIFDLGEDNQQGDFQILYAMQRETDDDQQKSIDGWTGFVSDPAAVDGTMTDAWTRARDELDETRLYFDDHLVTFQWLGPAQCLEERRIIQETVLGSIARNPDTTF